MGGSNDSERLYGCIEAGGTKFVLGIVTDDRRIVARKRLPTTKPLETLAAATQWLGQAAGQYGGIVALGIGTFGPACIDRDSAHWGWITSTPKPGWQDTDIAGPISRTLGVPVGFHTDVGAAAVAESRWGAARGQPVATYLTLGTGIGGGTTVDGRVLDGRSHAEMGHVPVRRDPLDTGFSGICPYHGDCLEGMASGPAIIARWGVPLSDLPANHQGHAMIAGYVAQLCLMLEALFSPGRIVIGGGVAKTPGLLSKVAAEMGKAAGGYFPGLDPYTLIVLPGLGEDAGLLGALALAQDAADAARI
jgi:fructokinase